MGQKWKFLATYSAGFSLAAKVTSREGMAKVKDRGWTRMRLSWTPIP